MRCKWQQGSNQQLLASRHRLRAAPNATILLPPLLLSPLLPLLGAELRRVQIPSRFTHDVVRHGDSVYVCDTGNGRVLQLSFPDMIPVRGDCRC